MQRHPRTGNVISNRGDLVNHADYMETVLRGIDPFGQSMTAEYTPIVESKPLPGLSVIRDNIVTTGTGSVTIDNGEKLINGTGGYAGLFTRDFGRYLPGVYGLAGIGVNLSDLGTGSAEFGYGNGAGNRMGMRVADGEYRTFVESEGVRYYDQPRSQWLDPLDGTGPSGANITLDRFVLRQMIGWYGYLSIEFYVAIKDRQLGDRLYLIDRSAAPPSGVNIQQPDLPVFGEAEGGALRVGGMQFGVFGRYNPQFRITGAWRSLTGVGTTFVPLISFRSKDTTRWRGVNIQIAGEETLSDNDIDTAIFVGSTLTGATFGNVPFVDPDETSLESDVSATALSGGYMAFPGLGAGAQGNQSALAGENIPDIQIPRTQSVTLAVRARAATTSVRGVLRVREEW